MNLLSLIYYMLLFYYNNIPLFYYNMPLFFYYMPLFYYMLLFYMPLFYIPFLLLNTIFFLINKPMILIIILIYTIFYLILKGKPKKIKLIINGYLDSFETINYKKYGRLMTPYKYWDSPIDYIVIDGEVSYKSDNYIFNWKPEIYLKIQQVNIPEGFDIFIKPTFDSNKEYSNDAIMTLKTDKNRKIKFIVCLRQNDINVKINEPILISFKINAFIIETKFLFFKANINESIEYRFHIGGDLGDTWVAFDPGTTGSCVAIGNHAENITICKDSYNQKIIDSKLNFFINEDYISNNGEIPEYLYEYGTKANTKFGSDGVMSFQSIKKLLGYKDKKEISFKNNNKLYLSGKELSSLLVKGLYNETINFIKRLNNNEFLNSSNFNPQRAVVAIPNNFTLSKTQDMIDCISNIKQFKEIRYVYEAEAVLFYYLSNYSHFNNTNSKFDKETILIFDMGGSSINATVIQASLLMEKNRPPIYYIDILGKIGYSIGGDTIDYCILKFIKEFSNEYPEFNLIDFYTKNKKDLVEAARAIKLNIIDYYEKGFDYLITTKQLSDFLSPLLGTSINISEDSKFYKNFIKNDKGEYGIFKNHIFDELIYDNVKDAVNEVLSLSGNCKIDKVIFSGRSIFFPYIRETVKKQFDTKDNPTIKFISLEKEESKTAVAYGACWYGINKDSIRLNNLKINATFGFKQTLTADMFDIKFFELIPMGYKFSTDNFEIDEVKGSKTISSNFPFDGGKINFYQIMGKNISEILKNNQKHKFSKIASIRIPQESKEIEMTVKENDEVICRVTLINNKIYEVNGAVSDQEITEANDEHYYWIIN